MNELMEQIKKKDARAFTHGGKFHADDVFSAALLILYKSGNYDFTWKSCAG